MPQGGGLIPKKTKLLKSFTADNTVGEVFGVGSPEKMTPVDRADKFIELQKLQIDNPYQFSDQKSLIGIEVEVENVQLVNPNLTLGFWSIDEDGSLRNNGREFKTLAIPIKYAEYALNHLSACLNPSVDFSIRTSVHIHQDVRGMTLSQLLSLIFTYTAVENLLFKYAGNSRRSSIYCVPLVETDLLSQFEDYKDMVNSLKHISVNWHKYSALNLIPIQNFGTVEYRHMPGTLNVKKLLIWIDLISRLKQWAYKTEYNDLSKQIADLNTNSQYIRFLEKVFGPALNYLDVSQVMADMEKGVYLVKHLAVANDFHQYIISSKFKYDSKLSQGLGLKDVETMLPTAEFEALKRLSKVFDLSSDLNNVYFSLTESRGYHYTVQEKARENPEVAKDFKLIMDFAKKGQELKTLKPEPFFVGVEEGGQF